MCGIVGYIGDKPALPTLMEGLRRLEYRGYDSAGVALVDNEQIWVRKQVGRVARLEQEVDGAKPPTTVGIAHTRWATHGGVTQPNAHPHLDTVGRIAVVHNGIIENMRALKNQLVAQGVEFRSETDSEILPHLIRHHYKGDPLEAVQATLARIRGTYGIVVAFADHPDVLVVARLGSPLVVGLGDGECVIGSDPQAIVAHTRRVVYLDDREIALVSRDGVQVHRLDGEKVAADVEVLEDDYGVADKEGYPHFMLKEIHEQPESIKRCLRGRVDHESGNAKLGGFNMGPREIVGIQGAVAIGCGTSYHAGLAGCLALETLARVPARAVIASEFRYRNPIIQPDALYFAISQSGETADTLGAVHEVQLKGGQVMGVINVVGSTIARTCGQGVYVHTGPEVAVASTKAFTSQVTAMLVATLMVSRTSNLSLEQGRGVARELRAMPGRVAEYLGDPGPIDAAVQRIVGARYVQFLGRGFSFPVALEGALKLKEIAYVPCEAYPAGEMKHGPIAMLEENTPVVFVAPQDSQRNKALSNLMEVKARGAAVIAIHTAGDEEIASLADVAIAIPECADYVSPLLSVLPMQLMAYGACVALGHDPDKPRNLAKSVTVE